MWKQCPQPCCGKCEVCQANSHQVWSLQDTKLVWLRIPASSSLREWHLHCSFNYNEVRQCYRYVCLHAYVCVYTWVCTTIKVVTECLQYMCSIAPWEVPCSCDEYMCMCAWAYASNCTCSLLHIPWVTYMHCRIAKGMKHGALHSCPRC